MNKSGWVGISLLAASFVGVLGCSYTDGPCYRKDSDYWKGGDGAGGGVLIPGSVGGYGDAPPDPKEGDPDVLENCNAEDQPEKPDTGSDTSACGNIDSGQFVEGETYVYCSGPCEDKCLSGGVAGFSAAAFNFTVLVADDGLGKGGGWQVASTSLRFVRWTEFLPEYWSCPITVGMPLRTEFMGKISSTFAANASAAIATKVGKDLKAIKPDLPPGIWCSKVAPSMEALFKKTYDSKLGATVTK